jgi:hypothetical protein
VTAEEWNHFDWSSVLCRHGPCHPGATEETILRSSLSTFQPITLDEIRVVRDNSRNPWFPGTPDYQNWLPTDASGWVFPLGPFPLSYLSLVRWANGGSFRVGVDREFELVPIDGIRGQMIELKSPKNMSLAVPFAWGDYYDFYCFDMRQGPSDEYPILVTGGNTMHYAISSCVAPGLLEFLQLPESPRPPNILLGDVIRSEEKD